MWAPLCPNYTAHLYILDAGRSSAVYLKNEFHCINRQPMPSIHHGTSPCVLLWKIRKDRSQMAFWIVISAKESTLTVWRRLLSLLRSIAVVYMNSQICAKFLTYESPQLVKDSLCQRRTQLHHDVSSSVWNLSGEGRWAKRKHDNPLKPIGFLVHHKPHPSAKSHNLISLSGLQIIIL